jgi:hypothetical protein
VWAKFYGTACIILEKINKIKVYSFFWLLVYIYILFTLRSSKEDITLFCDYCPLCFGVIFGPMAIVSPC